MSKSLVTGVIVLTTSELYREAWRALLQVQPFIEVIGTACHVEVAMAVKDTEMPTAMLVDFSAPHQDVARNLRATGIPHGLLFLVDSYEPGDILSLLQAGATGCLSRSATVADLSRAIIAAGRGELVLPSAVAMHTLAGLASELAARDTLVEELTGREYEVLNLLAQGLTNKDIAQRLFLSVRTVEAHLHNIYGKLDVASRTEAVLWAVHNDYASQD